MKKILCPFLGVIFAILLLFILLVTAVEAVCYWTPGYFAEEFKKYDVPSNLMAWRGEKMEMNSFLSVMEQTMLYLRGERENLIVNVDIDGESKEFYNENEKSHMADVQTLFLAGIFLRVIAILICLAILAVLILIEHKRAFYDLGRSYIGTCIVVLILAAGFGILAANDFTAYFTRFHEIFFSQGNWLFDPRESRMIDMLPEGFFSDTALRILICFGLFVLLMLIPAAIMVKIYDNKD